MQTPERPFGAAPDGAPSYEWLDEWLCEYVDGTMDPSLEAVFEQYVEANPELKAHVQRLQQTRELLGGCTAPDTPSTDPQVEVCTEVEDDLLQTSTVLPGLGARSAAALGVASAVVVALVVGFLAGSMLVETGPFSPTPVVSTVQESSPPVHSERQEAPPRRRTTAPSQRLQGSVFSTQEALVPRPASVSGADTVGTRRLTTGGDR